MKGMVRLSCFERLGWIKMHVGKANMDANSLSWSGRCTLEEKSSRRLNMSCTNMRLEGGMCSSRGIRAFATVSIDCALSARVVANPSTVTP